MFRRPRDQWRSKLSPKGGRRRGRGRGRSVYKTCTNTHTHMHTRTHTCTHTRPELINYSLKLAYYSNSLFSPFFPIIQMSLPDYSNDYDLLFNSKEVFISVKTQSLLHTQTYCILKNTEKFPSSLPCHSQALVRKFSHPLTRTNCFRFTRAFSVSSSLSLG